MDKTIKLINNKGKETKRNNKFTKGKDDAKNKKNEITKPNSDLLNKIQVSDADSSLTIGEDNGSVGWRSLPEILQSSDKCKTSDSVDTE